MKSYDERPDDWFKPNSRPITTFIYGVTVFAILIPVGLAIWLVAR